MTAAGSSMCTQVLWQQAASLNMYPVTLFHHHLLFTGLNNLEARISLLALAHVVVAGLFIVSVSACSTCSSNLACIACLLLFRTWRFAATGVSETLESPPWTQKYPKTIRKKQLYGDLFGNVLSRDWKPPAAAV
eukprot:6482815-Amphidinium_carterae.1